MHQSLMGAHVAKIVVKVMPKTEILDPQGQAIHNALTRLGYEGISSVRQGKCFEIEVNQSFSEKMITDIAESVLANMVIEEWTLIQDSK